MKVDLLKRLIKEAVREVLKEELHVLLEYRAGNIPPPSSNKKPTIPEVRNSMQTLEEVLSQTRQELTSDDYKNILGEGVSIGEPYKDRVIQNNEPQVGLDISNLSFIKKATTILNKANEFDKAR